MADGKVVISTELDNIGIEKGVKNIKGSLGGLTSMVKKLGTVIASAFAVQKIVQFGKESVNAANDLSAALTGLQSILDGQGRSFSAAQSFIEEYTKDGLIPATNAITAYKNLAMRGYDDSQIQQVMVALKDASAFGRQASYSMGEAVESATEGLKNENSILVDNAGVTKNVAKMWEEYAASIGTTANKLTQEQKIQAEVNGILEESKYQTGDAAKVSGTLSGQLQRLSFNFNNLKVAVGNAINPFVENVLPIINTAVEAFTRLANSVASVVGALFGKATVQTSALADSNSSVASSASAGAEAEKELADATKDAAQAAKKSLASFDELNVLQSNAGSGSGDTASSAGSSSVSTSIVADAQVEDTISPKLQAVVDKIKELVEPLKNIDFSPAVAAFERIKKAIEPLTAKLFDGLEWAWFNILVPLSQWTIQEAAPAVLDLLSSAFDLLSAALEPVISGLENLWVSLEPVFEWIGDTAVWVLEQFQKQFDKVSQVFRDKAPEIEKIFSGLGEVITAVWKLLEPVLTDLKKYWGVVFDYMCDKASKRISDIIDAMVGIVEFFAGAFTGDWKRAANGLIDIVNGLISGALGGINSLISAMNKLSFDVPDWVPLIGGETFCFNIPPIKIPQIPHLAQGAVIPPNREFMAILGDQRHGTNIEAPLSTIEEAVAKVTASAEQISLLREQNRLLQDILAKTGVYLDGKEIASTVSKYQNQQARARGW